MRGQEAMEREQVVVAAKLSVAAGLKRHPLCGGSSRGRGQEREELQRASVGGGRF